MAAAGQNQRISREAAMLAIEWKARFASVLQESAQRAGQGSETVTVDHYLQALPKALEALVQSVEKETAISNARRRAG